MKKILLPLAMIAALLFGCNTEHGHSHAEEEQGLEALAYTLYTDKTELFVEFKPLVVGMESKFAAHFTKLGPLFTAFTEGTISLSLTVSGKTSRVKATEPSNPGIFRLALKPEIAGVGSLVFDIQTKEFTDKITIDSVTVYPDEKAALAVQASEAGGGGGGDISYLKEQAWKVEFANEPVKRQPFTNVIKTSGQILSAPGDESLVTAKAGGIVHFLGANAIIGSEVAAGAALFTISGGDLAVGNLDASHREAKTNLDKAKVDLDRATDLVQDKLISQKEFQDTKLKYDLALIAFNTLGKNYSGSGQTITTQMGGFVKNILVTEGQRVEPGTALATISKNKKLILQANLSQKYFHLLNSIRSANIKATEGNAISTDSLHAQLVSYGKSTTANAPFVPISFEIDNTGNIIPGSVVEVFLKSDPIPDALVIPVSALVEEQGAFFVYVQTEGESFQKREVKLGANDGIQVQVLGGISEGERVVTQGAYQIKLSQASGTLPAHGHEH
ncbi:MAG: efflux RND transporter periplasmic adaptor subunit [Bacteroidia bacterium]|nr:efflux RND transporter periplasmic adaptor subunit [Bacteroidota bacterium]MBP6639643.1 efflux RND transporter periplasmic adaptor subunit [Bacteroidia bacterium]MBP6721152.1 efflux RND transporter periplasmic adaptor subunit [Bacteroidia bacterium]